MILLLLLFQPVHRPVLPLPVAYNVNTCAVYSANNLPSQGRNAQPLPPCQLVETPPPVPSYSRVTAVRIAHNFNQPVEEHMVSDPSDLVFQYRLLTES
jgi:hypothetical protein